MRFKDLDSQSEFMGVTGGTGGTGGTLRGCDFMWASRSATRADR